MDKNTLSKLKAYAECMSDGSSKTFLYKEICNQIENTQCGVFVRKVKLIQAEQVSVDYEEHVDRHGEKFIGLRDDFKCYDEDGNTYYIDRHKFFSNYAPFDERAFEIINEWKDRQLSKKKRILKNEQVQKEK